MHSSGSGLSRHRMMMALLLAAFSLFTVLNAQKVQDYTCSAESPCALGCCSGSGYCGFGPTFCGEGNCTSGCDRKSECDPGWGSVWSNATDCPLNVCCSQYGFCGTTKEFCGNKTVKAPSCPSSGNTAKKRVVGYYEAWSQQRNCNQIFPAQLPQGAWTHMNFAFVFIDPTDFTIVPMDPRDTSLYRPFTNLKTRYPGLETWISVGGWSMNDPGPFAPVFSDLAASEAHQDAFADSLINFMSDYGFDGVDIDWEYPGASERGGRPEDIRNFVTWLQRLRTRLGSKYGLTITIPSSYWYMRHFDVHALALTTDWLNIMTYDLHGTWDAPNPYVGPYVNSHTNLTEIDQAMDLLWRNDVPADKVALGLGFYGRSFTLADARCNSAGCVWTRGGDAGPCTANEGTLSFAEIEDIVANDKLDATVKYDRKAGVQEVTWTDAASADPQWVSYDDAATFGQKYHYANSKCLGGMLVWAASLDDRRGSGQRALCQSLGCTVHFNGDVSGGAPRSCGSSRFCERWHTVIGGDTCYALYAGAGITFEVLRALNPQLRADCSNLRLGEQYCVAGVPGDNSTASCTPRAPGIGGPSSTPGGGGYSTTGSLGPAPTGGPPPGGYSSDGDVGGGGKDTPYTTLAGGNVCYVGTSVVPVYPGDEEGKEL